MDYDKIGIGDRIRTARINKKLKQTEICDLLGISQPAYSSIESGNVDITISRLYQLATILGVSVVWLLGEDILADPTDNERLIMEDFKRFIKSIREK